MPTSHRQLYESLGFHSVRYLIIGDVAAIAYGVPRSTLDVDLLIEATLENATALLAALRDIGLGTAHLIEPPDLLRMEITVFDDVLRVDVQTRTPGLVFEEAWRRRRTETLAGVPVSLVSRDDLIASKEAAGRPLDLEDAAILCATAEEN